MKLGYRTLLLLAGLAPVMFGFVALAETWLSVVNKG